MAEVTTAPAEPTPEFNNSATPAPPAPESAYDQLAAEKKMLEDQRAKLNAEMHYTPDDAYTVQTVNTEVEAAREARIKEIEQEQQRERDFADFDKRMSNDFKNSSQNGNGNGM